MPLAPKLAVAMLLAGLPFLFLSVTAALPLVAVIVAVSVVGEMLWAPASEVIVSRLAPPGALGLYVGVATAAAWQHLGHAAPPGSPFAADGQDSLFDESPEDLPGHHPPDRPESARRP